ncbi:hypothetical protein ACE1BS_24260 [Aeromonas jandaei]
MKIVIGIFACSFMISACASDTPDAKPEKGWIEALADYQRNRDPKEEMIQESLRVMRIEHNKQGMNITESNTRQRQLEATMRALLGMEYK